MSRKSDLPLVLLFSFKRKKSIIIVFYFYFNSIIAQKNSFQSLIQQGFQEKVAEIAVSVSGNIRFHWWKPSFPFEETTVSIVAFSGNNHFPHKFCSNQIPHKSQINNYENEIYKEQK